MLIKVTSLLILLNCLFEISFCQYDKAISLNNNIKKDTVLIGGFFIKEYTGEKKNEKIKLDDNIFKITFKIDQKTYKYFIPLKKENKNNILDSLNAIKNSELK